MKTEILYVCEHCNHFKNTSDIEVANHELYCSSNSNALPPKTALEEFDPHNIEDKYLKYYDSVTIREYFRDMDHWCYINHIDILTLDQKRIPSWHYDHIKYSMEYQVIIDSVAYTLDQLEKFGNIRVLIYEDLSD